MPFNTTLQQVFRICITAITCMFFTCGAPNSACAQSTDSASTVTLTTDDGNVLPALYWHPLAADSPAVILLHMRRGNKEDYLSLGDKLQKEGYAAIAIDMRAHGDSIGPNDKPLALEYLKDSDYTDMLMDVKAAHDFLEDNKGVDPDRVAIIGASIGANLAIMYASGDKRVRTVISLSPGTNYRGLKPAAFLEEYGRRPLYLVASRKDKYSFESSLELKELASKADPVSLRLFDGKLHGTQLLDQMEGFADTLVSGWLLNYLPPRR